MIEPASLISGFREGLSVAGQFLHGEVEHSHWPAPHNPIAKPKDAAAVYVFALSKQAGKNCNAGSGRILKVGKAGQNSNARYQSQHYGFSAPSTVSKAIFFNPVLWPYLGILELEKEMVGDWLRKNTERYNFFLTGRDIALTSFLETYLKAVLSPVLEGVQSKDPK
ncbi:MAG: hypothetical protein V3U96_10725 [Paracoccaceae bacterium]